MLNLVIKNIIIICNDKRHCETTSFIPDWKKLGFDIEESWEKPLFSLSQKDEIIFPSNLTQKQIPGK